MTRRSICAHVQRFTFGIVPTMERISTASAVTMTPWSAILTTFMIAVSVRMNAKGADPNWR